MTNNSVVALLGAPLGITPLSEGGSIWGYSMPGLTAAGTMRGMVITDLMLTFTNGRLSYWTYGYTPDKPQPQGAPWSDLAMTVTNKQAGRIGFAFASEVPFPGSRHIATPDVPEAGYVSGVPDLEVTEVQDVQSTSPPAAEGRQEGRRAFRVWLTAGDGERLAAMTATNVGRRLVVFVGAEPVMAPVLNEPLMSGSIEIKCKNARSSERLDQALRAMRRQER